MVSTRGRPEPNQTKLEDFTEETNSVPTKKPQEKRKHENSKDAQTHVDKKIKTEDIHEEENKKKSPTHEPTASRDEEPKTRKQSDSSDEEIGKLDQRDVKKEEPAKKNSEQVRDDKPVTELKKSDDTDTHSEPIKINRAPVLTLFAACAAQFQYSKLPWPQCLSLGSAVSSMCAISKGRAIGQIPQASGDHESSSPPHERYVSVLGFQVPVKDGAAYVGDAKKGPNEGYLKSKFGERYAQVKETMLRAMATWSGHEEEFEKKGFHMYEKFRPGSGAWGQVGGLYIEEVEKTITRP